MMNALNRSSQIFFKLLVFNSSILFSMSLQRLVLFLVVIRHWIFGTEGFVIANSFFTGLRFDLCVLGFVNIPVLFIVWILSTDYLAKTSNKFLMFVRRWILWVYLGITTLVIHILGLLDMMYFAANGSRWNLFAWYENGWSFFSKVAASWGGVFTFGVIALFLMLWVFRCLFTLYKLKLQDLPELNSQRPKALLFLFGFVLPVFIVALSARGTWTAHHIGLEHAEVSQIQVLNQMTLSPVWAFDKKF